MGLYQAMYSAVSGLNANGTSMGVIGDNIANSNTVGFKRSRANFADIVSQTLIGATATFSQMGQGVLVSDIQQIHSQGSLLSTGLDTDMAISGSGYFMVNGTVNGQTGTFYTRAGQFHIDEDGFLVNPQDLRLQGYGVTEDGQINGAIGDINLTSSNIPPLATENISITANLDSESEQLVPIFDPNDPYNTSNFATAVTVYDSLGNSHQVDIFFRRGAANDWEWHALMDGGELSGGTSGVPTEIASGTLGFTTDGRLDTETVVGGVVDFNNATPGQTISFDFGPSITTDGGDGETGTTQYSARSSINFQTQDGYTTGSLTRIAIDSEGVIRGAYSNGEVRTVGQILLASFQNPEGLYKLGSNVWGETGDSGLPLVGMANSGPRGAVMSQNLEQSNVDLAEEFVNMIVTQRAFQANSKSITTVDSMLAEVINLKR
ncbi:flagellar hook protein FlgE [bacterium]|nr:flagellar hook protein FlgE [bacterium]